MGKKLKVLMVFDCQMTRPADHDYTEDLKEEAFKGYGEINNALKNNGHIVSMLGLHKDLRILIDEIEKNRPDVVFNVADVFNSQSRFDKNIAWILEMLDVPYTGATPAELLICNNKALSKQILSFHKIKVPHFYTFYRTRKVRRPKKIKLPLIVKPLCEEASRGISQASVVDSDKALSERVQFIHEKMGMDAIAEEYIDGREFYVSLMGHKRIISFPIREMKFGQVPEDEPRIATYKGKWDNEYRKKWGMRNVFIGKLPEGWEKKIFDTCKRAHRALNLKSYTRVDIRVTGEGNIYIIELNANPNLEKDDEFANSADKAGISFDSLVQKIINLALEN